jgi:eukaryotic-like serine/threonine-protein kinase
VTGGDPVLGRVLLGRYRVVEQLARGGMGVVYLGRVEGAAGFAKPVVIKTIIPHLKYDTSIEGMFVREGRILSNLQHPHIVGVLDFGKTSDAYLMVLEYVHGFHLGQWLRFLALEERKMQVEHAVHVATVVLDALHYAHRMTRPDGTLLGIVHRDVSPANVLIGVDGQVKLHDFGIARMAEEVTGEYRTQDNSFKGTLAFAAPETLRGQSASPRSDLYACAVLLYLSLAGSNPFKGQQASETVARVLGYMQPALRSLREDVSPELDAVLTRALSKSPEDRYPSAAAFADALRDACPRSDQDLEADFARVVQRDFSGPLSQRLQVPSLEQRDRAWRQTTTSDTASPTPSVSPQPSLSAIASSAPATARIVTETLRQSPRFSSAPPPNQERRSRLLAPLLVSSVVLALTAGLLLARERPAPVANIVVEKHVEAAEPVTSADAPAAPPADSSVGSSLSAASQAGGKVSAAAPAIGSAPAQRSGALNTAAQLSQAFQKQQGAVTRCFAQHANAVEGQPRLAVRFNIDRSGKVQSAELNPPALAGTELGACILAAARATRFPEQPDSVSFTIPLTARHAR